MLRVSYLSAVRRPACDFSKQFHLNRPPIEFGPLSKMFKRFWLVTKDHGTIKRQIFYHRQQYELISNCSLVHGGWSSWSAWGGCPVTCGGGLEQRDRTCTNPRPALFGDHCFGRNHEDRICARQSCTGSFGTYFKFNINIFAEYTPTIARISCLHFVMHMHASTQFTVALLKGNMSDSFTNYNYVGNTKVSVSTKKLMPTNAH